MLVDYGAKRLQPRGVAAETSEQISAQRFVPAPPRFKDHPPKNRDLHTCRQRADNDE
jgi:hypothetical protein